MGRVIRAQRKGAGGIFKSHLNIAKDQPKFVLWIIRKGTATLKVLFKPYSL
jgi:hypothetical protein